MNLLKHILLHISLLKCNILYFDVCVSSGRGNVSYKTHS